jgi:hypothetical protein
MTWTAITDDASRGPQSSEGSLDHGLVHARAIAKAKERTFRRPSMTSITFFTVVYQYTREVPAHGDNPCLEELRLPNGQYGLVEIDVHFVEFDRLAEPQGGSIQGQQERA